jgi:hypothetical protein
LKTRGCRSGDSSRVAANGYNAALLAERRRLTEHQE